MTTYVLVHGAWSGSHGFRHVRNRLQKAGHEVFTPSLTGIGERAHLSSPLVNLSTHVRDVVNQILYEDLNDIVLMGFSYEGFVVTGALEHIADRVAHLVYLDAFVPNDGDTLIGLVSGDGRQPVQVNEEWLVPAPERKFDDANEGKWISARRMPHPRGCFTEPVRLLRPPEEQAFTLTYIKATLGSPNANGTNALWRAAERAKAPPEWLYKEINTTHMVASNRPVELSQMLLEYGNSNQPHS